MTREYFLEDLKTQDAVIRNIEIIGEATKNLSDEIRNKYPEIPWNHMIGMRNRLIHGYFDVNLDIVWDTIRSDLPPLVEAFERVIEVEERN